MSYDELLATLPESDGRETSEGVCLVCFENGFCRDRADALASELTAHLFTVCGFDADEAAVLQWLLDEDEIGMMRDEDVEDLAERYLEEVEQ